MVCMRRSEKGGIQPSPILDAWRIIIKFKDAIGLSESFFLTIECMESLLIAELESYFPFASGIRLRRVA